MGNQPKLEHTEGGLAPGTLIGGEFLIQRQIGEGGMGVVYRAEQLSTGKVRAVKLMRACINTKRNIERFREEARVPARIQSEHVVDIIAAGFDETLQAPYLVMELLDGVTARQYLDQFGTPPLSDTISILRQLFHGVAAAHDLGLVHRDLKPDNIFLTETLGSEQDVYLLKILDFGVARFIHVDIEATSAVGSPGWMSPEQTENGAQLTLASDVWALAMIAFRMISGKHYYLGMQVQGMQPGAILKEMFLSEKVRASVRIAQLGASGAPEGFDDWFAQCTHVDPLQRYQHARQAGEALLAILCSDRPIEKASTERLERGLSLSPQSETLELLPEQKNTRRSNSKAQSRWWMALLIPISVGAYFLIREFNIEHPPKHSDGENQNITNTNASQSSSPAQKQLDAPQSPSEQSREISAFSTSTPSTTGKAKSPSPAVASPVIVSPPKTTQNDSSSTDESTPGNKNSAGVTSKPPSAAEPRDTLGNETQSAPPAAQQPSLPAIL